MTANEVRARLVALGLTAGYTAFVNFLPDEPDLAIAVNETGGFAPDGIFGQDGVSVERPGLQILVRGAPDDHDGPRMAIERIYQAAASWGAFVHAGGARYLNFDPAQAPFPLTRDPKNRRVFDVNFVVEKELSPTT